MPKAIHFISGTPRSGSTLLAAILRQNPDFHASVTSPLLALHNSLYAAMGAHQEWSTFISDAQRRDILRGLVPGYYDSIAANKIVFDTNRGWCAKLPSIAQLYPQARVIACVREYAWIIDSFERQFIKNPLLMSKLFSIEAGTTVYARADSLGGYHGVVGFAWHAFREAVFGEFANRLIVVDYEALTREPERTLAYLYNILGLPAFAHDFKNAVFDGVDEFDANLGAPGLHAVGREVRFSERKSVLPPDLFQQYRNNDYWKGPEFGQLGIPMCIWSRA